jgi:tetratricopeptide (TPR) repeat protein
MAEAETLAGDLILRDPLGRDAAELHVRILARRGRAEEAVAYADKVLAANPDTGDLEFYRSTALLELGDVGGAIESLVQAYERLSPPNMPADAAGFELVRARVYLSLALASLELPELAVRLDPPAAMQWLHDSGADVPPMSSVDPIVLRGLSPRYRARLLILQHDLEAALPWLEEAHRLGQSSNYVEHPDDYKAYLAMARRVSGDDTGAEAMAAEFAENLEDQVRKGDQSFVFLVPAEILSAAASQKRDEMYALIAQAEEGGSPLITLREAIFDPYRSEARFKRLQERFAAMRAAQRDDIERRGLIQRIEAVLAAQGAP